MGTVDDEKREVAQEIEEGRRVAVHRYLENTLPFKQFHVQELARWAQRLRD